jgi:hypothetical protein
MTRRLTAGLVAIASAGLLTASAQDLTRADSVSMEKKLAAIVERGTRAPGASAQPLKTPVSERELNAYLKFSPQVQMPPGLASPHFTIAEGGRVAARAMLDLDALRKSKPRGWTDPLGYVSGAVEVAVSGILYAAKGKGVFQLQSATLGGVSLPKALLQEIVSFYTKTPEHPNGWDIDSPFNLPQNIRQIEVQRGAATIVQ